MTDLTEVVVEKVEQDEDGGHERDEDEHGDRFHVEHGVLSLALLRSSVT